MWGVDGKRAVVETSFPTTDVETGFITLLRQSLSPGEPASYNKVHALLRARFLATQREGNCAVLDRWRFIHRKLLRRSAKTWVHLKVAEQAGVPVAPNMHHPPVDELINTYSYGALIHYGDRRDGLAALEQVDLDGASHRMSLHEAMSSLAAFYAGFAVMISTMFPSVT